HFNSRRLGRVVAAAAGKQKTFRSWESSVQFYLATVAARASWPGQPNHSMNHVARRLRNGLQYPEMIDISRFAKRPTATGPSLSRLQASQLGVELAGWLGPVTLEPSLETQPDRYPQISERLAPLIEEINARWEKRRQQAKQAKANDPKSDPPPRRQRKTVEELLEERAKDNNTDAADDPQ
ncbi:MAG: hypothetical protein MI861_05260, partial [Pirellulales bacterium]|nr:hypothetical protein [Pirellulales bacterium]